MCTRKIFALSTITALIISFSCTEEPLPAGLVLKMKTFSGGDGTTEIIRFMIGIADVELETKEENELEIENREENINELLEFRGPFKINLITGESAPEAGRAIVNQVDFDEIEIKLGAFLDKGKTLDLAFNKNGKSYEISTKIAVLEIELIQPETQSLKRNILTDLLIQLKQDDFIAGLDLSGVLPDTDGIYRINEETYPILTEKINELLKKSFQGGTDSDRDGVIDGNKADVSA